MKIIFFGTPEISEVYLKELINSTEVAAVITQPDRPKNRGYNLTPPPVKVIALENGIPVFQPEKFDQAVIEQLRAFNPDAGVVVSYGKLIPETVFKIPKLGCFNIHFSLLPKYRGAAPMQWALINGEKETGVSSFWLEKTLDSGPLIVQKSTLIENDDNQVSLAKRLTSLGIVVMQETLDRLNKGLTQGKPQTGTPTYAPSLKKEDGRIDWSKSADTIINLIRGANPWPGAYTKIKEGSLKDKTLKILKAHVLEAKQDAPAGQIIEIVHNAGFIVSCGLGSVLIEEVHLENKKQTSAWNFLQGCHGKTGDQIFN